MNEKEVVGAQPRGDRAGRMKTDCPERDLNLKLRRMISLARHDINNQLTIVNGYLALLESGTLKTGEVTPILLNATGRIDRILKFTREYQELGVTPPAWQDIGETLHAARAETDTGNVGFVTGEECRGIEVRADPRFFRVFSSLIENSLRHAGTVTEIRVRCVPGPARLTIIYEDNGTGIPDAVRPVLFEPAKGKNSGYGLFLASEILGVTGLTIAETGERGKGARFEICVPAGMFRLTR